MTRAWSLVGGDAVVVQVADVVDGPVGGEPDGVEAVSQGGCLGGMISEPAPWSILQGMDFARSEEQVITGLTVETAAAGVPVRARGHKGGRVDQRGIGIGTQQDRSPAGPLAAWQRCGTLGAA
jgi:hypothetical protein